MSEKQAASRREFLTIATTGAAAAGAATALGAGRVEAAEVAEATDGYRETPHVKAYLDSARF